MFHGFVKSRSFARRLLHAPKRVCCFLAFAAFFNVLPAVPTVQAQPISSLYGRKIVLVDNELIVGPSAKEIKASADDMARVLSRMTRQEYSVVTETGANAAAIAEGIFLVPTASTIAPPDAVTKLKGQGREPFIIRSGDAKKLLITANSGEGLGHGIYYYLDLLGARWLMPGDKWEVIPMRTSIGGRIDTMLSPDFKIRNFFGTGGFGKALPVDMKGDLAVRWAQWKKRNRFGGEYGLGGHSGEAFNLANKAFLLEHPDYLAKINGQYVPWSLTAKLNTANPDAVKMYVDWTVNRFRAMRKADPNAFAVSVDPSDGGGHCNSDECKKIGNGSASDQIFYIANEAAKAVRAEFPDGWVNLYGYNEHAAPPSFPVEPNVYVSVIPYAFQRTGMAPDEFIKAWGRKVSRIGMYNYWSIPDWSGDLPSFDFRNTPREQLRFWRENKVEGYSSESTFSGGAMGPGWYVASRLMWNPQADDKAVLDEWFQYSFGPAQAPMRRMLERWASGFMLIGNEMALSYRDLAEAQKLAQDEPAVLARLADYGRYLEYLRLRHAYTIAPRDARPEALRQLVRHVWRIYPSHMIHAFRIYQLLARDDKKIGEEFPIGDAKAPIWQELTPISDEEAFARVAEGTKLTLLDFSTRRYAGELTAVPKSTLPQLPPDFEPTKTIPFIGQVNLVVQVPEGVKNLAFQLSSGPPMRVKLIGSDGGVLYDKSTAGSNPNPIAMEDVTIPLPKAGRYRLSLIQEKNTGFTFAPPRNVGLTLLPFRTSKGQPTPPMFFFVPKGVTNVAIYEGAALPENMQPRLWTPTGEEVKAQVHEGRRVLLYPVPAGQDGKVWKIARIVAPNSAIEMINAPEAFAFTPDALLIPKDALP